MQVNQIELCTMKTIFQKSDQFFVAVSDYTPIFCFQDSLVESSCRKLSSWKHVVHIEIALKGQSLSSRRLRVVAVPFMNQSGKFLRRG